MFLISAPGIWDLPKLTSEPVAEPAASQANRAGDGSCL